jgi:Fic-DOC domain mobile mystery protein B
MSSLAELLGGEAKFLVPFHLTTLDELLLHEQRNGMAARTWAFNRRARHDPLTLPFLSALHQRLFRDIWRWAGQLRRRDHPDGARWPTIGIELNDLLGEARFWRERAIYGPDELALRFHHRLLRIRAWEGGNGTHARLAADAVVVSLKRPPFSWGLRSNSPRESAREQYVAALRDADAGSFDSLRDFARST